MPIQLTLSDNERIQIDVSLDDWNQAYQRALQNGTMVEIEEPDGRIVSINPHRVILIETCPPARVAS
jgi:hypothetical protein